jgi:hypothetical protein
MDSATRCGSYVPVTTIGIVQFSNQKPTGNEPADLPAKYSRLPAGRHQRPMLADVPQMTWFADIKMPLWLFFDKIDE